MNMGKMKELFYERIPTDPKGYEEYQIKHKRYRYMTENRTMIIEAVLSSLLCINYHMSTSLLTGIPIIGLFFGGMMFMIGMVYKNDEFHDEELIYDGVLEPYEVRRDSFLWYLITVINMGTFLSIVAMRGKLLPYYGQPGIDEMSSMTIGSAAFLLAIVPAFINFDIQRLVIHTVLVTPMFIINAIIIESSADPFQIGFDMWIIYRFVTICMAIIALRIIIKRKKQEIQHKVDRE